MVSMHIITRSIYPNRVPKELHFRMFTTTRIDGFSRKKKNIIIVFLEPKCFRIVQTHLGKNAVNKKPEVNNVRI